MIVDEKAKARMHADLSRGQYRAWIGYALNGIEKEDETYYIHGDPFDNGEPPRIECLLHRIVLTGPYYGYEELEKRLGGLKLNERPPRANYKQMFWSNVPGFYRRISIWPVGYRKPTCVEIWPSRRVELKEHKRGLITLMNALPELQLSSVEYAIDIYCRYPDGVENLFYELLRYLLVPSRKDARLAGGQIVDGVMMNRVFHVMGRNATVKIYERGADQRRQGKAWPLPVRDRVRLELTAKRSKLLYHELDGLYDLIERPRFLELNGSVYRFKLFKKGLPQPWEYPVRDNKGVGLPAFQAEYWHHHELGHKVGQRTRDCQDMIPLQKALLEAMRNFDREWEMV